MKITERKCKQIVGGAAAAALLLSGVHLPGAAWKEVKADTVSVNAKITKELINKRNRFLKQFALSDGSFTAVAYSMPVHYKKKGVWKEIDTTMKKVGKKKYQTKSTELTIQVSKKSNKKAVITLKRGSNSISWALKGKKVKSANVKIRNPKKSKQTDVLNQNIVSYSKVLKNTSITYNIFPERVQEVITVSKKQKAKKWTFKINAGKMKIKVKGNQVYFKTKKGKKKYQRLHTIVTDANGVSTSKVKVKYNKKKKTLTVTPSKKWWNSKKRKFPMEMRTSYLTDKHSRNVKVGAAYSGAPNGTFTYDKSLLLQANKCIGFVQMSAIADLKKPNAQIRSAALHIKNKKTLKMGAGKTFDISVHKVKDKWSAKKLTFNNRPAYEAEAAAKTGIQKKGSYSLDVTALVRGWHQGENNYGAALAAENTNRTYQAELDRNPYFAVNYEVVGFDGAVQLKENEPITRDIIKEGQENYFYFDTKPGIAYEVYTDSAMDTQATMYDESKERVGYADDTGTNKNFSFVGSYNKRRYIKVGAKDKATGSYTLHLKKRFAVPEVTGIKGQDSYTLTWQPVEHAKEYVVCIYDGSRKIGETIVTGTSYEYLYTNDTVRKTLGFTVTARENKTLTGESSRMVYNTASQSEWVYQTPMEKSRKNASVVTAGEKLYVLGGENETGSLSSFAAFDTEKKTWESLPDYPGNVSGICKAAMIADNKDIYVIGGQTSTKTDAKALKNVYVYHTESKQWQKKADMKEGRTNLSTAVCDKKVYAFSKAGATDRVDVYDLNTDTWETTVMPGTSTILGAAAVDNRVFVLKEKESSLFFEEYLPEENTWEEPGTVCPYTVSDRFAAPVVIRGKIYLVKESETKDVYVYDAYLDEWSEVSAMNLKKQESFLAACGNELYSIGGEMTGFGVLDVVEHYTVKVQTTKKQMEVRQGSHYELQINAGNLKKGQSKVVTISVNPKELEIKNASSFAEEDDLKEGVDGITLLKYQPKKGVLVWKLTGSLERFESCETYQSIPVEAKKDGKTEIAYTMTEQS